jgi:uncharacterized cupredoxin-like copper-binding protein
VRASATGLAGGLAFNFKTGSGGLTAVDPGTGKVLWQNKLPSEDFGAATVANDVVFTSTYAGTIYAFDTKTARRSGRRRRPQASTPSRDRRRHLAGWRRRSRVLQEPALRVDRLLAVGDRRGECARSAGSGTTTTTPPVSGSGAGPSGQTSTASTIQVKGGEFFFRLSTKSIAKPGKATFVFTNIGHVAHDFKIDGKVTPLIQPGQTTKLAVTFTKAGSYPYLCTVPGHAEAGMKGTFTVR